MGRSQAGGRTHQRQTLAADSEDSTGSPPQRAGATPGVRTWLPTGRGLLGGILVASAVAGVLVAHRAASQPPSDRFVVVTNQVDAGSPLRSEDLGTVAAQLPDGVSAVPAERADQFVGRVARVQLEPMAMLRDGDLYDRGRFAPPAATEVALDLSPSQALLGTVRVGDRVDVLSTDPNGQGTAVVAAGVIVSDVGADQDGTAIGSAGAVRVRLGLPDAVSAASLVDAAVRTELTLVLPSPRDDRTGAAETGGPS